MTFQELVALAYREPGITLGFLLVLFFGAGVLLYTILNFLAVVIRGWPNENHHTDPK